MYCQPRMPILQENRKTDKWIPFPRREAYNFGQERVHMGPLDVPEVLILLGIVAGIVWAVYNWTHPHPHLPK
jgi:hypothetical protein